jgi:glucose dehydrogenase
MNVKDRRGRWFAAPAALAVLVVALLASANAGAQGGEDSDWSSVNGTLDGQRYSPPTQIDTTSVKGLKVAWRFRVSTPGAEA